MTRMQSNGRRCCLAAMRMRDRENTRPEAERFSQPRDWLVVRNTEFDHQLASSLLKRGLTSALIGRPQTFHYNRGRVVQPVWSKNSADVQKP
jgi:hypothetical protein